MSTKKQIANLAKLKLNQLQAKYTEVIGKETRSHNKTFLIRKIGEALQANQNSTKSDAGTTPETSVSASAAAVAPATEKLSKLTVLELQARYLDVVGRASGSPNKAYLIWKIREARKGRIPIGPRKSARQDVAFKVLPLRMESAIVEKLDGVWKRQGLHSRADLFRKSLHIFLRDSGENEVAALLAEDVKR